MRLEKDELKIYYRGELNIKLDVALEEALNEFGYERWASGMEIESGIRDMAFDKTNSVSEIKNLNSINGFHWASAKNNKEGFGRVSICDERLWLRDCERQDNGTMKGVVDNVPLFTSKHGLKLDDVVIFKHTFGRNQEDKHA